MTEPVRVFFIDEAAGLEPDPDLLALILAGRIRHLHLPDPDFRSRYLAGRQMMVDDAYYGLTPDEQLAAHLPQVLRPDQFRGKYRHPDVKATDG